MLHKLMNSVLSDDHIIISNDEKNNSYDLHRDTRKLPERCYQMQAGFLLPGQKNYTSKSNFQYYKGLIQLNG